LIAQLAGLRPLKIGKQGAARIVCNRGESAAGRTEAKPVQRQRCRFFASGDQTKISARSIARQYSSSNVAKIPL
jgi:hypothetical protein